MAEEGLAQIQNEYWSQTQVALLVTACCSAPCSAAVNYGKTRRENGIEDNFGRATEVCLFKIFFGCFFILM